MGLPPHAVLDVRVLRGGCVVEIHLLSPGEQPLEAGKAVHSSYTNNRVWVDERCESAVAWQRHGLYGDPL
jgi:hypothetical protein